MEKEESKAPEVYKKKKLLGEGASGKAYLVQCGSDKSKAVVKQINVEDMADKDREKTLKESQYMALFKHPNIVRFRENYMTKKGNLCIVMDYCDDGDLYKYLESLDTKLKEEDILNLFVQICLALKEIHDERIIHRDLKSMNIFLTKRGILKLGDFGIAKLFSTMTVEARTRIGSPCYLSPEIVSDQPYKQSSDIWSLGVLLYELCCLTPPFAGSNFNDLCENIKIGKYEDIPVFYSEELGQLIKAMLNVDPNMRPTINDILQHPLLVPPLLEHVKSDIFKKEFIYLSKFVKAKSEDTKEETSSKKSLTREQLRYKEYVNKIEELINPPEECKPSKS
ncbi:unnamed protein product [Moneuplotes crassus]|uniref:non-specific serine/threonine protein kinase n=1 Tax=Euplotes crassus TaxID=5936 RepID=A0AAD1XIB2_EUPCR|nr:unnamed protein product [Moneuplotes crassus]